VIRDTITLGKYRAVPVIGEEVERNLFGDMVIVRADAADPCDLDLGFCKNVVRSCSSG
jgi:hypothetical protein